MEDKLVLADKVLRSRLFLGTGRWRNTREMLAALKASRTDLVTVAIRRLDLSDPNQKTLLETRNLTARAS